MVVNDCGVCGNGISISGERKYSVVGRSAYSCSSCDESFIMEFNGGFVNSDQALDEAWISDNISPKYTDSASDSKIFDSATPREEIAVAFLNEMAQAEDSIFMSFQAEKKPILATRQGSAAGYIIWDYYQWEDGETPRLLQIFVIDDQRRNGVGSTLLNYFERTYTDVGEFFFVHNPGEEMYYLLAATDHLELDDTDELVYNGVRWQGVTFDIPDDIREYV